MYLFLKSDPDPTKIPGFGPTTTIESVCMTQGNYDMKFSIDETSGVISVKEPLKPKGKPGVYIFHYT